jgi:transcriptional regulator with XRE-family HTH domain
MSQDDHYINGELLRLGREARGWLIGDMAIRACMSVKQIRQLEEGGTSAFYSPAVKMTSAKKLAGILDIAPEQVFQRPGSAALETVTPVATEITVTPADDQPAVAEDIAPPQPAVVHTTPEPQDATPSAASAAVEPKAKTSVWAIVALFVAALGVAAYMHQQEEPATEPPPPLQVLPTEAEPAASAAESEASNASAASDRVAVPAASAPVTPASAVPKPAASAASKPL